ncbi:MAG: hypothetical protein ACOCNE_07070, partial [Prevotella pectinovora]
YQRAKIQITKPQSLEKITKLQEMGSTLARVGQAAFSTWASTLPQVGTGGAQNCAQSFHGMKLVF